MKNKIIYSAGMLIFCLFVLLIPLNIMENTINKDKSKVTKLRDIDSKQQLEFAVEEENFHTKLQLLSGKFKSDKTITSENDIPTKRKNGAILTIKAQLYLLYQLGYYPVDVMNNNYTITIEECYYTEQIFEKYTCCVYNIIFENEAEKHSVTLDVYDFRIYNLETKLKGGTSVSSSYLNNLGQIKDDEIYAYIETFACIISNENEISSYSSDKNSDKSIVNKVADNIYQITKRDEFDYYAKLNKKENYIKFELVSEL